MVTRPLLLVNGILISDPVGFDYWNVVPGQGEYYNPDFIENGVRKRVPGMLPILQLILPSTG